jgi:hypothetical protein
MSLPAGYPSGGEAGAALLADKDSMFLVKRKAISFHGPVLARIVTGFNVI